jgi:predicted nucleotidyltransferase
MDFSSCIERARGDERILALYLLGSAQAGTMRPDSDVDLAILLGPGRRIDSLERASIAAETSLALGREVDLGEVSSRNLI